MPFTPGTFTDTQISEALIREDELLQESRMSELKQSIVAGQAILSHQSPQLITQGFGASCINANMYALRSNSLEKATTGVACAVGATQQAGSEAVTLTKSILTKSQGFIINDTLCANDVEFGKLKAYLGLRAKIGLEVALTQTIVSTVNTGIDTPVATDYETAGTVVSDVFQVQNSNFTVDLIADLQWVAKKHDIADPIIVSGRNFFNKHVLQQYESNGAATNDAILNTNNVFDLYWDAKNVETITGADTSLVIDKNAHLFWSQPFYSNMGMDTAMTEGKEASDRFHWVEILPRLQYFANGQMNPIYVDVRAEWSCIADAQGIPRDAWKFEYFLGGCSRLNLPNQNDLQGIYKIQKVADP